MRREKRHERRMQRVSGSDILRREKRERKTRERERETYVEREREGEMQRREAILIFVSFPRP